MNATIRDMPLKLKRIVIEVIQMISFSGMYAQIQSQFHGYCQQIHMI
jgi:hypothetical protein